MPDLDCLRHGTLEEHEPPSLKRKKVLGLLPRASFAATSLVPRWERCLELARLWGIPVVEEPGWQTRGRPYDVEYGGALAHHTATSAFAPGDYPSRGIVRDGRSDLPGPLAQVGLGRLGSWWMIAAGYSNHAGGGGWDGLSGNWSVIGVEAENDGVGTPWTAAQIRNYPRVLAILCLVFEFPVRRVCRHAEWSDGGKIDTATEPFANGDHLRHLVNQALAELLTLLNPPQPEPEVLTDMPCTYDFDGHIWAYGDNRLVRLTHPLQAEAHRKTGAVDLSAPGVLSPSGGLVHSSVHEFYVALAGPDRVIIISERSALA